jgi:hypothetical protein
MVAGRSTESKTFAVTKTSGQATVTAAAGSFTEEDAGRPITGTGIAASTTILSVQSDTAATLSANATASNSATATIGGTALADGQTYGYIGWSPESDAESEVYTLAANNLGTAQPDRITNPYTAVSQRSRG